MVESLAEAEAMNAELWECSQVWHSISAGADSRKAKSGNTTQAETGSRQVPHFSLTEKQEVEF
jgi:hypothetical protein